MKREGSSVFSPPRYFSANANDFSHARPVVVLYVAIVPAAVRFRHQYIYLLPQQFVRFIANIRQAAGLSSP